MAIVGVKVNGKDYHIACGDGQEQHAYELSQELDIRARQMASQVGPAPENMILLLTGLMLADEMGEAQREVRNLEREVTRLARELRDVRAEANSPDAHAASAMLDAVAERIERLSRRFEML